MRTAGGSHLGNAQRGKISQRQLGGDLIVGLVGTQHNGLAAAAQKIANLFVLRANAVLTVDHPDQHAGLGNHAADLLADHAVKKVHPFLTVQSAQTAGVNQQKRLALILGWRHDAVARYPALLMYDGKTTVQNRVEQCRLAHIGASDYGYYG